MGKLKRIGRWRSNADPGVQISDGLERHYGIREATRQACHGCDLSQASVHARAAFQDVIAAETCSHHELPPQSGVGSNGLSRNGDKATTPNY